jgi:anti-sigma regulatory factor (Ser/Thr protein kinase)
MGRQNGDRSANNNAHQALVYASDEEFLDYTVPFVNSGLAAGDRVLVVTNRHNLDLLEAHTPTTGQPSLDMHDSATWYSTPSRTLTAFDDYAQDQERAERRVRILGESVRGDGVLLERAWQRYESLLNLTFEDRHVTLACPYRSELLTARQTNELDYTHHHTTITGHRHASTIFQETADFIARRDSAPLMRPEQTAVHRTDFAIATLGEVRSLVARSADAAGVPPRQIPDLLVAMNEVTANAVRHGGGRGRLRTWYEPEFVVFEVDDDGTQEPSPLAGHIRPDASHPRAGGMGLWMARQLTDMLEVRHGPGWVVRIYAHTTS